MDEERPERQDGSHPERGTGQRQDHRAAPPGHKIPGEPPNLDDPEAPEQREHGLEQNQAPSPPD